MCFNKHFLSPFSPGHTLLAVRAPSGTQLDVPIPKAVSSASPEPDLLCSLAFLGVFLRMVYYVHTPLSGPELPGKVPDPSEKHQWADRCRAS